MATASEIIVKLTRANENRAIASKIRTEFGLAKVETQEDYDAIIKALIAELEAEADSAQKI